MMSLYCPPAAMLSPRRRYDGAGFVVVTKPTPRPFDVAAWPATRRPQQLDRVVLSIDTAPGTSGAAASRCGLVMLGLAEQHAHIMLAEERRLEYAELRDVVIELCRGVVDVEVVIENTVSGAALASDFRQLGYYVSTVTPHRSKLERALAISSAAQRHLCVDDDVSTATAIGLQQLSLFPDVDRDDVADALSQALAYCYPLEVTDVIVADALFDVVVKSTNQRRGVVFKASGKW